MNNSLEELFDILTDLQNEFITEEKKLKEISSTHAYRIDELDHQINTARKNEDIDFRVFSPRNLSIDNSNKIKALEDEKSSLEKEKSDADRQMSYYTGKADRLTLAVNIVKKYIKSDIVLSEESEIANNTNDSIEDSIIEKIKKKPYNNFSFLYEDEENDSEVENEDLDKVEKLFNEDDNNDDLPLKLENDNLDKDSNVVLGDSSCNGIPVDEIERVCHKVEISEKIINNDRVRARMQLKDVIVELKDLIKAYK